MNKLVVFLIAALLTNLGCNKESAKTPDKGGVAEDNKAKDAPLYKGKPASFWIEQSKDKDASFRLEAVKALGEIGSDREDVISALALALEDKETEVRLCSVDALDKLESKSADEALKKIGCKARSFTNSIGMKFVWIKRGSFMMGSPKEEEGRWARETQHKVTLTKGFYMGVYAVTQEEWQAVMGNNPSYFRGEKNLPVNDVSWNDCQEFIKKSREKDKKPYRLPTEAEWEYACRAGTKTPFHFGETISTEQANYNGDFIYGNGVKGIFRKKITPVGSFPANAWGLHDMHGNVVQWCQDWFWEYPENDVVDPTGPEKGQKRVLRGGASGASPDHCRSAVRFAFDPAFHAGDMGLRICFFVE
jgi:formylglycine-generating enzyme required for sulfatase activity